MTVYLGRNIITKGSTKRFWGKKSHFTAKFLYHIKLHSEANRVQRSTESPEERVCGSIEHGKTDFQKLINNLNYAGENVPRKFVLND